MPEPNVTIDMDRHCSGCGRAGATGSGLCLGCAFDRILTAMKERERTSMDQQMSLTMAWVELTPEERNERGQKLAQALRSLTALDEDHKERKIEMRKERQQVLQEIAHIADVVSSGHEERPVGTARE